MHKKEKQFSRQVCVKFVRLRKIKIVIAPLFTLTSLVHTPNTLLVRSSGKVVHRTSETSILPKYTADILNQIGTI